MLSQIGMLIQACPSAPLWLHRLSPTAPLTDIQLTCIQVTRYPMISPTLRQPRSCSPSFFRETRNGFCRGVRNDLGYALYRLQLGQTPPDRKPVQSVGAGVYELREGDARAWYRILYIRREKVVQVLHCFEKRSNAIEQKDIETAKTRLKRVLEAEREEKRNAKQALRGK